jgi:hypothetical protein
MGKKPRKKLTPAKSAHKQAVERNISALLRHTKELNRNSAALAVHTAVLSDASVSRLVRKPPTYPYAEAESIVLRAFKSLGKPSVKDTDNLRDLNFRTTTDLLGLLDAVNNQIPNWPAPGLDDTRLS